MQDFELYKIVKKATGNDERIVFKVLEDTNSPIIYSWIIHMMQKAKFLMLIGILSRSQM